MSASGVFPLKVQPHQGFAVRQRLRLPQDPGVSGLLQGRRQRVLLHLVMDLVQPVKHMEIRGIGIVHVPSLFGVSVVRGEKCLDLVITFKRLQDIVGEIDRIGQTRRVRNILGVDVPNVVIPVSAGRDLVNLVETAAMQQRLIMSGKNPVFDLSERLRRRADSARQASKNGKRGE